MNNNDNKPFYDEALRFLMKHVLVIYIVVVTTLTLVVTFLQIIGVHK